MILFASFLHSFFEYNYHVLGMLLVNAAALGIGYLHFFARSANGSSGWGTQVRGWPTSCLACASFTPGRPARWDRSWRGGGSKLFLAGRMEEAGRWFRRASLADPWRGTYPDSGSAMFYRLFEEGKGERNLYRAIELEQEAYLRNPMDFRYPARLGGPVASPRQRITFRLPLGGRSSMLRFPRMTRQLRATPTPRICGT